MDELSTDADGPAQADIAVIILSYKAPETLIAAVRSVCTQAISAELVVVNSGGGEAGQKLAAAGLNVRVIESSARLLPGGARNLGIASTRAALVAFLADDCVARPGWLKERLRAHREGAAAVASALLCHKPKNPVALAAHLSLFVRRMPSIPAPLALAYGASYQRRLFSAYGAFRDDMEGGEDTEFHRRLAPADKPVWRPQVQTVHAGAETLGAFLSDQFRRGRRIAAAWREIGPITKGAVAKDALKRTGFILKHAPRVVKSEQRWAARLAAPLIVLGNLVYAFGALTARQGRQA